MYNILFFITEVTSYKLLVVQLFQFSFFLGKKLNHCGGYMNFQHTEQQLQENSLYHFHHYSFLKTFVKFRCFFRPFKSSTGNFCVLPNYTYYLHLKIWNMTTLFYIMIFYLLAISFKISINSATCSTCDTFFCH